MSILSVGTEGYPRVSLPSIPAALLEGRHEARRDMQRVRLKGQIERVAEQLHHLAARLRPAALRKQGCRADTCRKSRLWVKQGVDAAKSYFAVLTSQ